MRRAEGFTLVETLVAFTLLAVVAAAALRGLGQGAEAGALAGSRLEAVARAQALLAAAEAGAETGAETGAAPADPGGDWTERLTLEPGPEGLLAATAEVRWTTAGRERTLRLATLVWAP